MSDKPNLTGDAPNDACELQRYSNDLEDEIKRLKAILRDHRNMKYFLGDPCESCTHNEYKRATFNDPEQSGCAVHEDVQKESIEDSERDTLSMCPKWEKKDE